MEQKFDFIEVTLDPKDYDLIKEVYRLHKEQANKIFDLACGINTDEDIMDYVSNHIENDITLLAVDKETGKYAGVVILDNMVVNEEEIVSSGVHLVVSKRYWGPGSRRLIFDVFDYFRNNMKPMNRLEAYVPANNFGIIKILKDTGFHIEGTLKRRLIFKNRNGIPTHYNELVYSNMNIGEENG